MASEASEARRRETADKMELAAIELFAARGYNDVTVEEIAKAVGVHLRTVLRYFRVKEDLLLAMPRRSLRRIAEEIAKRPRDESPLEATCQGVVVATARSKSDHARSLPWAAAAASYPEGLITVSFEAMHEYAVAIQGRLDGVYPPDMARAVAHSISGAIYGLWREWIEEGAQEDFAELTCRGLRLLESAAAITQAGLLDEIASLRKENQDLRVERELFKRAATALLEQPRQGE